MKISLPSLILTSVSMTILLTACSAELVRSDDKLIVVKARASDRAGAQDIAENECQRRGLHARLTNKPASDQFGFDCVR